MFHPQNLRYRPAGEADIEALLQFVPLMLQGYWSADGLRQLLRAHEVRVLEVMSTEEIVGFAEFTLVLDESELLSLAVHPRCHRQGVGRLLLAAVSREAAKLGAVKILLEVRESNVAARALYEQQGFVQNGIRPGYYAPPAVGSPREDACLYLLELESSSRA